MFGEKVLSHFREPHNAGEPANASHAGEVTNPVCGDVLRLTVRVENERIVAACFKAQGCVPSIAAASAMTDMLVGKTLTDAKRISPAEIALALDGLPESSTHAAELCCDAIAALRPIG
ncbi:MAG TPA: iron-sulfur cluster assembly scaffold protein [Candidatus Acidoferrales bacterium]|nr:iron-sulfur cluster assembly scaffold protein [Candidatus Acidoferrales bacterium]